MQITPASVLRHQALGSEALYRVASVEDSLIEVQVVRAPGLIQGTRLRFTAAAAAAMELVSAEPIRAARLPQRSGFVAPSARSHLHLVH